VEGIVGELEKQVNAIGGFIKRSDANGYRDPAGWPLRLMRVNLSDPFADNLRAHSRLLESAIGEDEGEFLAPIAAGDILRHGLHGEESHRARPECDPQQR